jgi:hypothetical protein
MQHARWEGCSEPCLRNCHAHSTHHEHLNTDEEFVRISLARSWAPAALKGHVLNTSHNHPGQNQHANNLLAAAFLIVAHLQGCAKDTQEAANQSM